MAWHFIRRSAWIVDILWKQIKKNDFRNYLQISKFSLLQVYWVQKISNQNPVQWLNKEEFY